MSDKLTRAEAIDERVWTALVAAKDLATLCENTDPDDMGDLYELRAQVQSVQTLLIDAMKPVDRALTREGAVHVRPGLHEAALEAAVQTGTPQDGLQARGVHHDRARPEERSQGVARRDV